MKAHSKLFIDQERTSLYQLFRYIGQYMFYAVFTLEDCYNTHKTTIEIAL